MKNLNKQTLERVINLMSHKTRLVIKSDMQALLKASNEHVLIHKHAKQVLDEIEHYPATRTE